MDIDSVPYLPDPDAMDVDSDDMDIDEPSPDLDPVDGETTSSDNQEVRYAGGYDHCVLTCSPSSPRRTPIRTRRTSILTRPRSTLLCTPARIFTTGLFLIHVSASD